MKYNLRNQTCWRVLKRCFVFHGRRLQITVKSVRPCVYSYICMCRTGHKVSIPPRARGEDRPIGLAEQAGARVLYHSSLNTHRERECKTALNIKGNNLLADK